MSIKLCDKTVFFDNLEVENKNQFFEYVTNELLKLERIENPQRILYKFDKRESEVATFLGSHFAIPHLKSSKVLENTIVFARLKNSIVWNKNNDKVKYIFAVLVKPSYENLHIDILMSISRNIIDKNKIDILKRSSNVDDILNIINTVY